MHIRTRISFALAATMAALFIFAVCWCMVPKAFASESTSGSSYLGISEATTAGADDFIFPRSSYELLTEEDVQACTSEELYFARNEIYARHGYIFVSEDLQERFSNMVWYVPLYTASEFSSDDFNSVEICNIAMIQQQEAVLAGTSTISDYIFPTSSTELLDEWDFWGCTTYDLYLGRNEIFARHGYIFESADLDAYFRSKSWYIPQYSASEFDWNCLNSIESQNVSFISEREELLAGATTPTTTVPEFTSDTDTVTVSDTGHVTTPYFSFDIPESWLGYVAVTCEMHGDYPSITISLKDYPGLRLCSFYVQEANTAEYVTGGQINAGMLDFWYNDTGQFIYMWGWNYVFFTEEGRFEGMQYDYYPTDYIEAALIDLSTGGVYTVETAKLSQQGSGQGVSGFAYYESVVATTVVVF